jgi:uncharacterized protein YjbI with pentapeptide repeats
MANQDHLQQLLKGVESWNKWRDENPNIHPDLRDFDFTDEQTFGHSPIWSADEKRVYLMHANLDNVDFWRSNLARVYFTGSSLKNANVRGSSLRRTNFNETNITGANFSFARFEENNVSNIVYSRKRMRGMWQGIRGTETIFGDAIFRRDVIDQDMIDTIWAKSKFSPIGILTLSLWRLTDYGRSWLSVVILAIAAMVIFGFVYGWSEAQGWVRFSEEIGARNQFTPFFVAAMGFATLGLTDLVMPANIFGQITMIANVTSGFVTLGLLLSVLSNSFARRA